MAHGASRRSVGLFSVVACSLFLNTCAARTVAAPTPPVLRRVLITVDVSDDVWICVQPTAAMQMWQPTTASMVCVEQVGAIRWRASHEDKAD